MKKLVEMLASVAGDLERTSVPYALTGSMASSLHGQPRMTADADIVLRLDIDTARELARKWTPQYYVPEESLFEAVQHDGMANIVEASTGFKIDLSVLSDTPYHDAVLARSGPIALPGLPDTSVQVVTREDIILMKLVWRKDTRSQRQYDDALSVARTHGASMDWAYLKRWAHELDVANDLDTLRVDAGLG